MTWPLTPLEQGGNYSVILADPPWDMKTNSVNKPGRNPRRHYGTMSLADIAAFPVKEIVADDAVLWMWITSPFLVIGAHIPVMKAWGFKPTAMGFVWVKMKRGREAVASSDDLFMGTGFTTRKNAEFCIMGKRGRSLRVDAGVHEIILAPVREHSRKPDEARARIERYVGPGHRKAELFGRESADGWETFGNQSDKFDEATE